LVLVDHCSALNPLQCCLAVDVCLSGDKKSQLKAAQDSRSAANGPSDASVSTSVPDAELQRRLELKDEEVKLYKNKFEECNKQLLQAVR